MRSGLSLGLLVAALMAAPQALAEETLLEHTINACRPDLEKFCSGVTPGEGRMLHCLAAYEDQISGRCDYALYQAATLLQQVGAAILHVAEQCETEIDTLCEDVEAGEGRILACLDEHDKQLGESCKQAIADTVGD